MRYILCVDDDEGIRVLYQRLCQRHFPDYGFLGADTNTKALALARASDIALVITDHDRKNAAERGSELVWGLRRSLEMQCPVLMVSAYHPKDLQQEGVERAGVNAVLWKLDITGEGFIQIVREFLDSGVSPTYENYAKK